MPISTFLSREIFNCFYFFLNSFLFRSIVTEFPSSFPFVRLLRPGRRPRNSEGGSYATFSLARQLYPGGLGPFAG